MIRPRSSLLIALLLWAACHKPRPVEPKLTVEQQMMKAAEFALECMSSAGTDCLSLSPMTDAWSAQGDLELLTTTPAALVADQLIAAAGELRAGQLTLTRIDAEARRVATRTYDLSCHGREAQQVASEVAGRRKQLATRARFLGLFATAAGPAVEELLVASEPLATAWLIRAECKEGPIFLLLAPPSRELEPDDDPRAYIGGGWEVVGVSDDPARLLHGHVNPSPAPSPPVIDRPPPGVVDPWIPVTEVEL